MHRKCLLMTQSGHCRPLTSLVRTATMSCPKPRGQQSGGAISSKDCCGFGGYVAACRARPTADNAGNWFCQRQFPPMALRDNFGFSQRAERGRYVDGRNVAIEYRWAEGRSDRLPAMVTGLRCSVPECRGIGSMLIPHSGRPMGQILHGSAKTTHAVRAAIQHRRLRSKSSPGATTSTRRR